MTVGSVGCNVVGGLVGGNVAGGLVGGLVGGDVVTELVSGNLAIVGGGDGGGVSSVTTVYLLHLAVRQLRPGVLDAVTSAGIDVCSMHSSLTRL